MSHNEVQEEYEKRLRNELEECQEKLNKIIEEFRHLKFKYNSTYRILKCIDVHKNKKPTAKITYASIHQVPNIKERNKNISWYREINKIFITDQNKHVYRTISEIYDMINSDNKFDNSKKNIHCISLTHALDRAVKTGKMNLMRDGNRKLYRWVNETIRVVRAFEN